MSLTEPMVNPFEVLKLQSKEEIRNFYLNSKNKELVKKILIDNHNKDIEEKSISGRYEFLMEEFPSKEINLKAIQYFTSFCKKDELRKFFESQNKFEITDEEWSNIFLNTGKLCIKELLAQKDFPKETLNKKAIKLLQEYHHEEAIQYIKDTKIDVNNIIIPLAKENNGTALNEVYKAFKSDIKQETTDKAFLESIPAQMTNPIIMSGINPISQMLNNDTVTISDGEEEVIKDKSELESFMKGFIVAEIQNNIDSQKNQNLIPQQTQRNNNNNRNAMNVMLGQNITNNALNQGLVNCINNNQFKDAKRIVVEKDFLSNHEGLFETIEKKKHQLNNKEKFAEQVYNNQDDLKKIKSQSNDLNELKNTLDKNLKTDNPEVNKSQELDKPKINKKDLGLSL